MPHRAGKNTLDNGLDLAAQEPLTWLVQRHLHHAIDRRGIMLNQDF